MRTKQQVKEDNATILAAGVAFYLLLALPPALVAVLSVYGIVSDPADVTDTVERFEAALPQGAQDLIEAQLKSASTSSPGRLGISLIIAVLVALLSASKGAKSLVEAINVAYDEPETRGFLRLRLLALAFTVGGVALILIGLTVITLIPTLTDPLGSGGQLAASIIRWPLLAVAMVAALAVLFRFGPDRDDPRWAWVTPGAIFAAVAWVLGSLAFALFADKFGTFNEIYGTLGAVVALLLWLYITAYVIIIAAEVNAELERQTYEDTTRGAEKPLGRRGAFAADTVGPTADATKAAKGTPTKRAADQVGPDGTR
jgi:membrane protein